MLSWVAPHVKKGEAFSITIWQVDLKNTLVLLRESWLVDHTEKCGKNIRLTTLTCTVRFIRIRKALLVVAVFHVALALLFIGVVKYRRGTVWLAVIWFSSHEWIATRFWREQFCSNNDKKTGQTYKKCLLFQRQHKKTSWQLLEIFYWTLITRQSFSKSLSSHTHSHTQPFSDINPSLKLFLLHTLRLSGE